MSSWSRTQIPWKTSHLSSPTFTSIKKIHLDSTFLSSSSECAWKEIIVFVALGYCQQGFAPVCLPSLKASRLPSSWCPPPPPPELFSKLKLGVLYLFSGFPGKKKNMGNYCLNYSGTAPAATDLQPRKSCPCDLPGSSFECLKLSFSHKWEGFLPIYTMLSPNVFVQEDGSTIFLGTNHENLIPPPTPCNNFFYPVVFGNQSNLKVSYGQNWTEFPWLVFVPSLH